MNHIQEILDKSITHFPDNIALIDLQGKSITYNELYNRAEDIAIHLTQCKLNNAASIAILIPKSIEAVAALFAILKLNVAYIPLDEMSPPRRINSILKQSKCNAIIIDARLMEADIFDGISIIKKVTSFYGDLDLIVFDNSQASCVDEENAAVLYTSGSTGLPKGVCLSHKNMLAFIKWSAKEIRLNHNDKVMSIAPFHFDLSVFDLFATLLSGGTVFLVPAIEAKNPMMISMLIGQWNISCIYTTPTMLGLINRYGKVERYNHEALRTVIFAGEVMPSLTLENLLKIWPSCNYYNFYGPTETNVISFYKVNTQKSIPDPIPIGYPCDYAELRVLKEGKIHEFSGDLEGELVVKGDSVFNYYHNLNSENAFYTDDENKKWYLTGDKISISDNNELIYIGRIDRMIKKNGYRIELDEIEKVLCLHENILTAASILNKEGKLILFYTELTKVKNDNQYREHLLLYLPMYMMPDKFIKLDEFPQTSSHKINYQLLKAYEF